MKNPKRVALVTAIVGIYLAYTIFGATETPGTLVSIMYWAFLIIAAVGFIGAVTQMARGLPD